MPENAWEVRSPPVALEMSKNVSPRDTLARDTVCTVFQVGEGLHIRKSIHNGLVVSAANARMSHVNPRVTTLSPFSVAAILYR